jgi:hypothetical protein
MLCKTNVSLSIPIYLCILASVCMYKSVCVADLCGNMILINFQPDSRF